MMLHHHPRKRWTLAGAALALAAAVAVWAPPALAEQTVTVYKSPT